MAKLDLWIEAQNYQNLSRPEAIRWFVEIGLSKEADGTMLRYKDYIMSKEHKNNADNYLKAAHGHLNAAILLEKNLDIDAASSANNSLLLPTYNVLGFAVELYMKSYLALHGYTDEDLRKKFGHNLKKLREECVKLGFHLHEDAIKTIVDKLAQNHGDYSYRYLKNGSEIVYFTKGESVNTVFKALAEFNEYLLYRVKH